MTNSRIYILDPTNRRLLPMISEDYIDEDVLQSYIADYPDLIPGDQINPESPRRWLLVKREMGVPDANDAYGDRWSLDHLLLDQDGVPTFVEVKRSVDTRIRREVIGQMLDYAANGLAYWTLARLRQSAAETALVRGQNLDDLLADLLGNGSEEAREVYWQQVAENLGKGSVRLLFAVDKAPPELRRLTEFLNAKLNDVEVLIVELKQYRGEAGTAISPVVIGSTEASRERKHTRTRTRPLSHDEFFEACPENVASFFHALIKLTIECGYEIKWNPTSFTARLRESTTGSWQSLLLGWTGSWDVAVYYGAVDDVDPTAGQRLRKMIATSGLFPNGTTRNSSTRKPVDPASGDLVLDVIRRYLLEARSTLQNNLESN